MTKEDAAIMGGRTSSFQIGPDEEKDSVATETLLMKLAMAQAVISVMADYISNVQGDCSGSLVAPDEWAISGAVGNLDNVMHALKCGCWGYKEAYNH